MPSWWECGGGGGWRTGGTRGQGMTVVECRGGGARGSRRGGREYGGGEGGRREKEREERGGAEEGERGRQSLRQRRSYGARVRTGMSYVILLGDVLTGVAWRTPWLYRDAAACIYLSPFFRLGGRSRG